MQTETWCQDRRPSAELLLAISLALVCTVPWGHAQAQDPCVGHLAMDRVSLNLQESSTLALLELIGGSANTSDDWDVQIGKVMEKIPSVDVKRAKTAASSYFKNSKLDWTHDRLLSVATQTLSERAVEAYRICTDGQHVSGPRITVYDATPTAVTVKIRWMKSPLAPDTTTLRIAVQGGTLDEPFNALWVTNTSSTRFIARAANEDLKIAVDGGGDTDDAFVAYIPPVSVASPVLRIGSCTGHGGMLGIRFWGPAGTDERCNGIESWGSYDAQVQEVIELGTCKGKGGFAPVTLYGPVGELCGGIQSWGTYVKIADPKVDVMRSGIAACAGVGSLLGGHLLWGPSDAVCAGIPSWRSYVLHRKMPG